MEGNKNLAIIGGNGSLTAIVAKSAREQGYKTCGIAITDEAKSQFQDLCSKVYRFSPGQVSKIFNLFKDEMIQQVVFIGKVPKLDLLRNIHKLDWLAIKNLSLLSNLNDDSIHTGIANFLSEHNIRILPQTQFLQNLFQGKETLSKRKPTLDERADIEYGFNIAKQIAGLDIGQTVVVKNKMIVAIEAIEGTDETIKRGCLLSKGGVVVVKVAKPNQDERFDIPTIGEKTIEILAKHGSGILAFEAHKTIIAGKEKVIQAADKNNVGLIAI